MWNSSNVIYKQLRLNKGKIFLILLLIVFLGVIELFIPMITQSLIDIGILQEDLIKIFKLTALLIVLSFLISVMNGLLSILFAKTSIKIITDIKKDIYSKLLRYPISFFDEHKTGYLMSRIDEVNSLNTLFSPVLVNYFKSIFSFVGAVIVLAYIKWELLCFSILLLPFYVIITKKTSRRILKSSKKLNESTAEANGEINENIRGVEELKKFNLEEKKGNEINKSISYIAQLSFVRNVFTILGNEIISFFLMMSRSLFMMIIGYFIIQGELTIGAFFSVLAYTTNLFRPIQLHSSINMSVQPALAALSRINVFFNREPELKSSGLYEVNEIMSIEFIKVTFSYPNTETPVIENLSFLIEKGGKLYIYGSNGSGKTTITKLILGLYSDYSGVILINGRDIRELNIDIYRKSIGIVSQHAQLFSGSVIENIKLWDETITDLVIDTILKEYNLTDFLKDPTYNSRSISELGKNLSGGQIQEIALIRAILRQPSLYIFDEPTSNLDSDNRNKFIQVIEKVENQICITITHDKELLSNIHRNNMLIVNLDNA